MLSAEMQNEGLEPCIQDSQCFHQHACSTRGFQWHGGTEPFGILPEMRGHGLEPWPHHLQCCQKHASLKRDFSQTFLRLMGFLFYFKGLLVKPFLAVFLDVILRARGSQCHEAFKLLAEIQDEGSNACIHHLQCRHKHAFVLSGSQFMSP